MEEISFLAAFGAGLLSFLSPCVLPLAASWLVFISPRKANRRDALAAALCFIA
ncbi:MAG: cytochrome c biogenesis protein CcdA, partial [Spirochaetaceae bacterium]|nr:cytochrome c biogenesis protein CcdA [Spirochaetaceae bacterium]